MCRERSFALGLLLVTVLSSAMPAQGVPVAGTSQFYRLQAAVAGKRVVVIHADGRQEEIGEAWLNADGVLRKVSDSLGVQIGLLNTIKVRESATGKGAAIGALIGGLSFLTMGVALASDDFFEVGTGEVALMTLVGIGGGGLTGALIGAPFSYWKTVYRAPATVRPTVGFGDRGVRLGARVSF